MFVTKNLSGWLVNSDASIRDALRVVESQKNGIVFVVDAEKKLVGSFTDGDFRRAILRETLITLEDSVDRIVNKNCKYHFAENASVPLDEQFSSGVAAFPILSSRFSVEAIACKNAPLIKLTNRIIGENHPVFVIAEIGNNHNGSLDKAYRLIEGAAEAGVDCVKFQMRDLADLYGKNLLDDSSADLGCEYTLDLLKRFQLTDDQLFRAMDYARECGLEPLCTPWDRSSLKKLEAYGLNFFKIASADLTNDVLLDEAAASDKPLIVSTGMSTESEIRHAATLLRSRGVAFSLLHCNSTYPVPFCEINLRGMKNLEAMSPCPVGYSGHEHGWEVCIAAVALGAKIVEKHLTSDRSQEGSDHKVSLLPSEFKSMVTAIRNVEDSLGSALPRKVSQGERLNRENLAKSIVARRPLKKGDTILRDDLIVKSPGSGLQPSRMSELIGRETIREVPEGDFFYPSDLYEATSWSRHYSFPLKFGIPVRLHDAEKLMSLRNLSLVEFHHSYADLDLNPGDYVGIHENVELVVHCPELFRGDHILDLASKCQDYRAKSIMNLQRTIDNTLTLQKYFPQTKNTKIVVNVGGFSERGFLNPEERQERYLLVNDSLSKLDTTGVTLLIQTMPPFPWHFGGQRFHNLFVNPFEISKFCSQYNHLVCFDSSHSALACNYYGWKLPLFIEEISPYIRHSHLADASGDKEEGLQIGSGTIDFMTLLNVLYRECRNSSFIPEIWQGHKESGAEFWAALDALQKISFRCTDETEATEC